MKTRNVLWSIIIAICIIVPLVSAAHWEKQYHIMEEQLIESHDSHMSELQEIEQECLDLFNGINALDKQLIANNQLLKENQAQLEENQEKLEEANSLIDAYKSEKYSVPCTVTDREIEMIAQTIWGEARGLNTYEQSLVIWCILNRVDDGTWGNTVAEVITAKYQFHGYSSNHPIVDEYKALAQDVVARWQMEKYCLGNVGRTLPKEYLYFHSQNGYHIFKTNYKHPYTSYDRSNGWNPYE